MHTITYVRILSSYIRAYARQLLIPGAPYVATARIADRQFIQIDATIESRFITYVIATALLVTLICDFASKYIPPRAISWKVRLSASDLSGRGARGAAGVGHLGEGGRGARGRGRGGQGAGPAASLHNARDLAKNNAISYLNVEIKQLAKVMRCLISTLIQQLLLKCDVLSKLLLLIKQQISQNACDVLSQRRGKPYYIANNASSYLDVEIRDQPGNARDRRPGERRNLLSQATRESGEEARVPSKQMMEKCPYESCSVGTCRKSVVCSVKAECL
jgi:hypothetical protein